MVVFIEKALHISGHVQFKPVLFKDQVNSHFIICLIIVIFEVFGSVLGGLVFLLVLASSVLLPLVLDYF